MSETQDLVRIAMETSGRLLSEFREGHDSISQRLKAVQKELETYEKSRFVSHAAAGHTIMFMVDFIKLLSMKGHMVIVRDTPKKISYKTLLMKETYKIDRNVTLEQIAENSVVSSLISHLDAHCQAVQCKGRLKVKSNPFDYSVCSSGDHHVQWEHLADIVFTVDGKEVPHDDVTIKYATEDIIEYANLIGPYLKHEFYSEEEEERIGFRSFKDYEFDFIAYRWV